jgi:hypothetical protein
MPAERWLAAAAWLGEHALSVYAVTLVALLLAAWAGWAAWGGRCGACGTVCRRLPGCC